MKIFSDNLPFFKANFHCHTTCSDGRVTPAECMQMYRDAGYSILTMSDHRTVTIPQNAPDGLLVIPGTEIDYTVSNQAVHILGIGVDKSLGSLWNRSGTPQEGIDLIHRLGGVAILAHPAWSLNTPDFIASLKGLSGVEIWNSVSTIPYNADRADSSSLLDVTWSQGGRLLPVMGNDDSHSYGSEFAAGATMVQACTCTFSDVMDALKKGSFYASQGPEIHQIEITGRTITLTCSPAETVIFYSNAYWSGDRCIQGHGITQCSYDLLDFERFIRIEIRDSNGRRAWSSPISTEGL